MRQGISWKKCVGNNQYIDDEFEKWMAVISRILLDIVCALLFINSARIMLSDVYYWGEFDLSNLKGQIVLAVIISVIMECADRVPKKIGFILKWGTLLAGAAICILNIRFSQETQYILSGIEKMISYYVDSWNTYYGTFIVYVTGNLIYVTESLNYVTLVLFFVLFWMAKMLRQNLVMAVAPAIVLVLELLVGYSPGYTGLMQLFLAVLISNTSKWYSVDFCVGPERKYISIGSVRFFSWIAVAIGIYLLCGMTKLTATSAAEDLLLYSDDMKNVYDELVDNFGDFSIADMFGEGKDSKKTRIDNDSPEYKDIDVLSLNVAVKPEDNIYLKGYYANVYDNGVWDIDVDSFKEACEEEGYDYEYVSGAITNIDVRTVLSRYNAEELMDTLFAHDATVTYHEDAGKVAYLPYFIEIDEYGITVEGDSRYRKDKNVNRINFVLWNFESVYDSKIMYNRGNTVDNWEYWYEVYIMEHYTKVPNNMPNVNSIAEELSKQFDYRDYIGNENYLRMEKAESVAIWMQKNTRYTLSPPDLPRGEEPVEYFLGTSKKGYCMHYASAAAMILRKMGVPARYASGYVVNENTFEATTSGYVAKIKDSDAHAWVEVYLEGIGWVPIEVTKGFNEDVIDRLRQEATSQMATTVPANRPGQQPTTSEKETTEKDREETRPTTSEKMTTKQGEESGEDIVGGGSDVKKITAKDVKKVILYIVGFAIITLVVFLVIRYREKYRERLQKEMQMKKCTSAIKLMNYRIYHKLRRIGKIVKIKVRDDEYKKALIAAYPEISVEDWEKFMVIVKAAAFSKNELSVEDMEFCYEVYCKVVGE